jgi:outer membrane protein
VLPAHFTGAPIPGDNPLMILTRYATFLCVAAFLAASASLHAQQRPLAEWKGYAGAGAIAFPKYTGGRGAETIPAPLLLFEYKETFYIDLVRAGVRLWSSADRSLALGLAAEPRFGFRAGDGVRLGGMAARRDSIELGPSLEWETPVLSFNLAWFGDASGNSRGSSLRASAYRQFIDSGRWDVGGYAGVDRASAKVVNYYFGVRGDEVAATRPFYQPGAATHWTLGISAAYKFNERHALLLGVQGTRLGGAAAASPIAETRSATIGYLGLGWRL